MVAVWIKWNNIGNSPCVQQMVKILAVVHFGIHAKWDYWSTFLGLLSYSFLLLRIIGKKNWCDSHREVFLTLDFCRLVGIPQLPVHLFLVSLFLSFVLFHSFSIIPSSKSKGFSSLSMGKPELPIVCFVTIRASSLCSSEWVFLAWIVLSLSSFAR